MVLLDFSKAYNTVWGKRLVLTITEKGLRIPMISLLRKFLINRQGQVCFNGVNSDRERVLGFQASSKTLLRTPSPRYGKNGEAMQIQSIQRRVFIPGHAKDRAKRAFVTGHCCSAGYSVPEIDESRRRREEPGATEAVSTSTQTAREQAGEKSERDRGREWRVPRV